MAPRNSNKKIANSLVAASSAAVLAVYAAGYARTESAAKKLEARVAERKPAEERRPQRPAENAEIRQLANSPPSALPLPVAASDLKREVAEKREPIVTVDSVPVPTIVPTPPVPPEASVTPVPVTPIEAKQAADPAPAPATPVWKDGTYTGWGTSRHGDIQATVMIEGGRIASAKIAQCLTRYSCDIIDKLPPQVAQRQSPETDYVSGATQSTNAFYYAVVEALNKAK